MEHFTLGMSREDYQMELRKKQDSDTAKVLFGKTDKEVSKICRGALADEQAQRRIAEFGYREMISWEKLLQTKLINKHL